MLTSRAFTKFNPRNKTLWCKSDEEALQYLVHEGAYREVKSLPNIVLLDLHMPGIGGLKTLHIIKDDENLKFIPVIMLTSSDSNKDVMSCFQGGANSYVQKPVSFKKMIKAIKGLNEYWFEVSLLPKEDLGPSSPDYIHPVEERA